MIGRRECVIPQVCARCGKTLEENWAIRLARHNLPGVCSVDLNEVLVEIEKSPSMWPSDWAGRSWEDPDGRWHYE